MAHKIHLPMDITSGHIEYVSAIPTLFLYIFGLHNRTSQITSSAKQLLLHHPEHRDLHKICTCSFRLKCGNGYYIQTWGRQSVHFPPTVSGPQLLAFFSMLDRANGSCSPAKFGDNGSCSPAKFGEPRFAHPCFKWKGNTPPQNERRRLTRLFHLLLCCYRLLMVLCY